MSASRDALGLDGVRVVVTGANGQLGRSLVRCARERGADVVGLGHEELELGRVDEVRDVLTASAPDVVIHGAAWTDVDGCERDPDKADRINGEGTAAVADACRARPGTRLVYVSTDFVFDGRGKRPYRPDDATGPVSAYGASKLLGERAVLRDADAGFYVVRTSWVFGPGGRNFPAAILGRARQGGPLTVVDDQVGIPTYTPDLAEALCDLAVSGAEPGIYHACNDAEPMSWWDFASLLVELDGLRVEVGRMASTELDRPAPRPAYSALDCARLTAVRGHALPEVPDAVRRYLAAEAENDS